MVGGLGVRLALSPTVMIRTEGLIIRSSAFSFSNYSGSLGLSFMIGSKPLNVVGDFRIRRNAKADRHLQSITLHRFDIAPDALRHRQSAFNGGVGENRNELFAPIAARRIVLPQAIPERLGHRLQHPVPLLMAKGVVEFLEVIDIGSPTRKARASASRAPARGCSPAPSTPTTPVACTIRRAPHSPEP
jgi:hypothetical protein